MKTVLFLGGGTAGHVTPNVALFPLLKPCNIAYAGARGSIEEKLILEQKRKFYEISCIKFRRKFSIKNLAIPFTLTKGVLQAKRLLKELKPSVIFSKGGFASLPVMIATNKKYPLIIHESDFSLGLASRLCVKKADKLLTSFSVTGEKYANAVTTGASIRQELYFGKRENALKECKLFRNKPYLLVFCGSLGAQAVSNALLGALDELLLHFNVIHVCGKLGKVEKQRDGYFCMQYCNNIADYYALCDLCLIRAGANSLAEVVALKKPTLSVPLPKGNSRGDQEQNAEYYKKRGLINVLPQSELNPKTLLNALLDTYYNSTQLKRAMLCAPSPDGSRKIADIINSYL